MTYPTPPFTSFFPETPEKALALAKEHTNSLYLAGGTDLVVNLRKRLHQPDCVIGLSRIPHLQRLELGEKEAFLGASLKLTQLAENPDIAKLFPSLAQAASLVAGPTLRQMATLGGNLLLDTRCKYYNQSYFWRKANHFCLKKEGEVCHVAPKGKFCWAAFSGDVAPVLLTLDAKLEIFSDKGKEIYPLSDFYGTDGRWSVGGALGGLPSKAILLGVYLPVVQEIFGVYVKLRIRESIDFPLVGMALTATFSSKTHPTLHTFRIGITAAAPKPLLLNLDKELSGKTLNKKTLGFVLAQIQQLAKPMRTTTVNPAYRRAMLSSLLEEGVEKLMAQNSFSRA